MREQSDALVDVVGAQYGAAHRAVHATGIGVRGIFTPAEGADRVSRAAIFAGPSVPVTARFSNSVGFPVLPGTEPDDRKPDVRGLAVKFHLSGESAITEMDMVGMSLTPFFARDVEGFLDFVRANLPNTSTGIPSSEAVKMWAHGHPYALPALTTFLGLGHDLSYAGIDYHGIHAFGYLNSKGEETWARFSWVPDQRIPQVPRADPDGVMAARTKDFLRRDIAQRCRSGQGAGFTLELTVAGPDDRLDDPTQVWTSVDRRTMGRLDLGAIVNDQYWGCEALAFNPTRVVDGVELPPDDAIIQARKEAYEESHARRTSPYPAPSKLPTNDAST